MYRLLLAISMLALGAAMAWAQNAPVAVPGGPYVTSVGESVILNAGGSYDPDARKGDRIVQYGWNLSTAGTNTDIVTASPVAAVPWAVLAGMLTEGVHYPANPVTNVPFAQIRLRVKDTTGLYGTAYTTLRIYDDRLFAVATATPNPASPASAVAFDGRASYCGHPSRTLVKYEWDFDGNGTWDAVGSTATHAYGVFGAFTAVLRVTDNLNRTATTTVPVQVTQGNHAPTVNSGGPYVLDEGSSLVLLAKGSDLDTPYGDAIVRYRWDLDGDGAFDDAQAGTGEVAVPWSSVPSRQIANPLTGLPRVDIGVQVEDSFGATGTATTRLTIYRNEPTAVFSLTPTSVAPGQSVAFDASTSTHGHPVHSIVQYAWDFDCPNPQAFQVEEQGKVVQHTFAAFGAFTVALRVTDDQNKTSIATQLVSVTQGNRPPAVAIGGPYTLETGAVLRLDASATVEPDAEYGDSITEYAWDLDGDGAFDDAIGAMPQLPWSTLQPLLQTPAQYPADPHTGLPRVALGLRVTDSFGFYAVGSTSLTIYSPNPVAVPAWQPRPEAPVGANSQAIVTLDGRASYHANPAHQIVSWVWRVKGAAQSVSGPSVGMAVDLTGVPLPTTKTLVLRVTDNLGRTDEAEFDVRFAQLPSNPPVIAANPSPIYLLPGEGATLSVPVADQDGDYLTRLAWDLNGDGTDDTIWTRTDTNGDGQVNASDANPILQLTLAWAMRVQYSLDALGPHALRITATDATGAVGTGYLNLVAIDAALRAEAAVMPPSGRPDQLFIFDGQASHHLMPGGAITSYEWDFTDDGAYDAQGSAVSHTYGAFGVYTTRLRVRDTLNRTATTTVTVAANAGNRPPQPVIRAALADTSTGTTFTVDANGSSDPDAMWGDSIIRYQWDLHSDGSYEIDDAQAILTAPWALLGAVSNGTSIPVTLEVRDTFGVTARVTGAITVGDYRPTASIILPQTPVVVGEDVVLTGNGSPVVPGRSIVRYQWDFAYNGPGTFDPTVEGKSIHVAFAVPGIHRVGMRATDSGGAVDTADVAVQVQPPTPTGLTVRPGWRGQAIVAWAAAPAYVERIELEGRLAGDWVPAGGFTDGETEKLVNGLMPGQTYTFRLRAFAAGQYSAYTDPVGIVAPDGLTAVSLAAAPGSPVALGVPVVLTPTVAGGSDLLCAFYAKFPGATTYTALGSTSVEPLTWNPTTPGTYTLMVSAREARGTAIESRRLYIAVTPKLAKVALGAVPAAAGVLGRRVTLAASVTGGALVEFAFSVVGATGTVYERGFGSGRSTWWTPDAMGAYTLTVTARDLSDGTTQTATQPFTVKPPLSALGLASSLASPVATGTRVVLTAVATGGATPEYRFLYGYRPTAQTATSKIVWDKSMAFRTGEFTWWTPTIAGIYNIRAYAREKGTTSAYEVATSTAPAGDVVFEVRPALTDFTLTCAPGAGSTTNIRANPAGGVNLRWKFYARKKGTTTWALVHDYQSDPVAPWTPDAPGPWEVMVYTKEATSKLYYDLSRTVPYTVP